MIPAAAGADQKTKEAATTNEDVAFSALGFRSSPENIIQQLKSKLT